MTLKKWLIVSLLIVSCLLIANKTLSQVSASHIVNGTVATTTTTVIAKTTVVKTFNSEVIRLSLKYKVSEPLARKIISCEGKMYKTRGNNINYDKKGVAWSEDVGWWQLNDYYHKQTALKKGLDIYNEWDNLEYGFWLLSTSGTSPWNASKYCWNK